MRINRFIIPGIDLNPGQQNITDQRVVKQIRLVLRLKPGATIEIGNGSGEVVGASVVEVGKDSVVVNIVDAPRQQPDVALPKVILACAIIKKENFELVVQKATELGVATIVPLRTDRTVKTNLNFERLNKIALEAAEQSGRGLVSSIIQPMTLETFLQSQYCTQPVVWFDTNQEDMPVSIKPTTVCIGPEGGWSDTERTLFANHGATCASLGALTLRAETAAIVAVFSSIR